MRSRAPRRRWVAGWSESSIWCRRTSIATRAPAPSPDRAQRLQSASRRVAIASAQLLLIVAAVIVIGYVLGRLRGRR